MQSFQMTLGVRGNQKILIFYLFVINFWNCLYIECVDA